MSFEINGPSNRPMIQEAQNMMNNGGGGNLGYFQREESEEAIRFDLNSEEDSFEKSIEEDDLQELETPDIIEKLLSYLKKLWASFLKLFIKK